MRTLTLEEQSKLLLEDGFPRPSIVLQTLLTSRDLHALTAIFI